MKAGAIIGVLLAVVISIILLPMLGRVADNPYDTTVTTTTSLPESTYIIIFDLYDIENFVSYGYHTVYCDDNSDCETKIASIIFSVQNVYISDVYNDGWVVAIDAFFAGTNIGVTNFGLYTMAISENATLNDQYPTPIYMNIRFYAQ